MKRDPTIPRKYKGPASLWLLILIYVVMVVLGVLWVRISDWLLPIAFQFRETFSDFERYTVEATYIIITSGILYWVMTRHLAAMRRYQEDLRESKERYQGLYDNAVVGLFRSRLADAAIIECNERVMEMFGYDDRNRFLAEFNIADHYVNPARRAFLVRELQQYRRADNAEVEFVRRDGSRFWARVSVQYFPGDDYLEGVIIDITEEKQAEKDLAAETERLAVTLRCIADGVITTDQ
ncbi:MAG: PAS domain-containing protein [Armatimonadota bacterium]